MFPALQFSENEEIVAMFIVSFPVLVNFNAILTSFDSSQYLSMSDSVHLTTKICTVQIDFIYHNIIYKHLHITSKIIYFHI